MKQFNSTRLISYRIIAIVFVLIAVTVIQAATITLTVKDTRKQTITGFGAACCDGAMCPYGTDTNPVRLLYGPTSKIGLNIMRMEISPSFNGDENASWSTYNWQGCVPSAKIVKQRGGIVFGTPWSPPGEYKTNGTAQGGKVNSQNDSDPQNQRGKLREDCYDKFFPWLNSYLKYMKSKGVQVDAVSLQNEPDWWVNYSGCLYDPNDLVTLVKNYAYMLDRETYSGVKLISGESLGFTQNYTDPLMNDATCREQIDIVAGHLYGHAPLEYMKKSAVLATKYGKEVWMTEHSIHDNLDRLPNWHEQLEFAEELNECMLAGCTGYIYWYMRAHWAFVSTGESKYGADNKVKNRLLPRAYVMSHFAKHVTGSTRLVTSRDKTSGERAALEYSAYIKGDSIIVMAIDTAKNGYDLNLQLPVKVKSGTHLISTGNEIENLCQEKPIKITESTKEVVVEMPARSFNTYILMIGESSTGTNEGENPPYTTPEFQLIYMIDGNIYKSFSIKVGEVITSEQVPTREGYSFSGWSNIPSTMPANDVTVTGTFRKNIYKLTYLIDGQVYKTISYEYGAAIATLAAPTKEGYTFSGWSNTLLTMPAKDVTISGWFSKGNYTLTYMVDGKLYSSFSYDYGAAITPLAAPTKEGCTFSGWSNIPLNMPANDVTVTGTFSKNKYKLTYMVDGQVYKTLNYEYGATIATVAAPTKEGYTFSGWSNAFLTMPARDVTITGSFIKTTPTIYKLTYMVDGELYSTFSYEYGATITPLAAPTKDGNTFSGWSTIPATMPNYDVTITGSFTKDKYTLTYMVNGVVYKTISYDYGEKITPEPEPTRDGATFSGWSWIPSKMPEEDVIVTGTFDVEMFKLTYKVDGEEYKTIELEAGAKITPEPAPTKEGYDFSGWSWIPSKMPDEDVTITGTFTPTTGVEAVISNSKLFDVYSTTGVLLRRQVTTLKGLPAGFYIVNGKKVHMKAQ